jgi:hypothetical protein
LPTDILIAGATMMAETSADCLGGTYQRLSGQEGWWPRVQDDGLLTDKPRFGEGKWLEPSKTLNMPITACLFMKSNVFRAIQRTWPKETSLHPSHEDTRICHEILKSGFNIWVTDRICVYHQHRSKTSQVLLKWARSGAAIASLAKTMQDDAFVRGRFRKAIVLCGFGVLTYGMIVSAFVVSGITAFLTSMSVLCAAMLLAGLVNAVRARDLRAILYPWGTLMLLGIFEFSFLMSMISEEKEYNPADLLQIC